MIRFPLPIIFFLLSLCGNVAAQNASHMPGEFLVSLEEGTSPASLSQRLSADARYQKVSELLNIWRLHTDLPERETLDWLRRQPAVRMAQFNHILEDRTLPDDPLFPQQWHLRNDGSGGGIPHADLDAEHAWEISTGGLTPAGDTIVLAVIDGGIQHSHPDLAANLWYNRGEIPNNGLDDDDNGYTDDFKGWNVFAQSDDIEGNTTTHGTPVSAILGARGNNGLGVSGVNWNTRIMFVAASGTEAEVLAAYDYVMRARRRYNTTWGAKGAFVVSVNCSWGINYGQPSEAPLWCAAFDLLGENGIVSVAATANLAVNVDEVGDLPTACPSNYLIGVTSLNSSDVKATSAAWGAQHVDLGAYGQEVFTASAGSGYETFSGTSFAAPQVAGAVGLLYAAPCPNLIALAKSNPAAAALWVKSLILDNSTPNASLSGKTLTGGRLNLFNVLKSYQSQCNNCPAPFALKTGLLTDSSAQLLWSKPSDALYVNLRWRKQSTGFWNQVLALTDSFLLSDLTLCTNYEFQVQSVCEAGVVSAWSASQVFQTNGCCSAPSSVWLESNGPEVVKIAWEASTNADHYRLLVRKPGFTGDWYETNSNTFLLEGLTACTEYEVQVQAHCVDVYTDLSPVMGFRTKGCGSCNELDYCPVKASEATEEWIETVRIDTWLHDSGAGGSGYQNFCVDQPFMPGFKAGFPASVFIAPGFFGGMSKEYYRIYVDFNQDGDFEDDGELAFDPGFALEGSVEGTIWPPLDLVPGITRLRVMMKFTTPNDNPPTPCTNFDFGQVEDYCAVLQLDLVQASVLPDKQPGTLRAFPQPAMDWVALELPEGVSTAGATLSVMDMTGKVLLSETSLLERNGRAYLQLNAWPAGMYVVQLKMAGRIYFGKIIRG